MNIPESVVMLVIGLFVALLQWIFTNSVIKRIDKLERNMGEKEKDNACSHKEIWIELHRVDKEHGERLAKIEQQKVDFEGIKKLLSTT